ncbi:MAG TPA: peptidylprolyl isomerase [Patescibacteria group bacterium]|nr:peptidylprolyl isomerase [Patescibacteria group bacterium]
MALKNKDFIEIEFTGKTKEGELFDSNIKEDLEELHRGHNHEIDTKPFIFCLGEGMFLRSIDEFLIGKPDSNFPATYEISLSPEKAFGVRNSQLIQMVPLKVFMQNDTRPVPGMMFNIDGRVAKILSVSGGRVIIDFNNPLAGKSVSYKIKVLRKVEDLNEKLKSFIEFLFKRDMKYEINEKKLILHVEKPMVDFVKLFSDKFKEIFELELEVKEEEAKEHAHEHVHEHTE